MAEQKEAVFVDGMIFKKPREGAPDFVKGHVSIKAPDLIKFLQKHAKLDGWVNIDMKKSKEGGKIYFQLNTYAPPIKSPALPDFPEEEINPDDIPF